jgi:hypothetical protein
MGDDVGHGEAELGAGSEVDDLKRRRGVRTSESKQE